MKVIKLGDIYTTIQVTCPKCKSVLEISNFDVKHGGGSVRYVICPCCDEMVRLNKEQKKELKV